MVNLSCSHCKIGLVKIFSGYKCPQCSFILQNVEGVLVDELSRNEKDKIFYDNLYETEHGEKWLQGLNRESFVKRILEKISLSYRRERFFKKNIKGKENLILDLACGAGRDYFKQFGAVVGVDLVFAPLRQARERYDMVIQTGCGALPFADSTFDYVVSSDFFGHVRLGDKDVIFGEILRVLKPGGRTLHVIETDSSNMWFRFAHMYPELFQKYFIEQIGGHVGLEMPDKVVERWQRNNFIIVKVKKIWGLIWPVQDYATLFNNEYKEKSWLVAVVVLLAQMLSHFKILQVATNVALNPLNSFIEFFFGFNNGQGVMIICQKKK